MFQLYCRGHSANFKGLCMIIGIRSRQLCLFLRSPATLAVGINTLQNFEVNKQILNFIQIDSKLYNSIFYCIGKDLGVWSIKF